MTKVKTKRGKKLGAGSPKQSFQVCAPDKPCDWFKQRVWDVIYSAEGRQIRKEHEALAKRQLALLEKHGVEADVMTRYSTENYYKRCVGKTELGRTGAHIMTLLDSPHIFIDWSPPDADTLDLDELEREAERISGVKFSDKHQG